MGRHRVHRFEVIEMIGSFMNVAQYEEALAAGELHTDGDPEAEIDDEQMQRSMASSSSLGDLLCKIWQFFLGIVNAVVEGVVGVILTVAKAAIRLLSEVVQVVGDGLSKLLSGPGGWILLAVGGFFLYGLISDDGKGDPDGGRSPTDRSTRT